jgi:hypothetical protein
MAVAKSYNFSLQNHENLGNRLIEGALITPITLLCLFWRKKKCSQSEAPKKFRKQLFQDALVCFSKIIHKIFPGKKLIQITWKDNEEGLPPWNVEVKEELFSLVEKKWGWTYQKEKPAIEEKQPKVSKYHKEKVAAEYLTITTCDKLESWNGTETAVCKNIFHMFEVAFL